MTCEFTAAPPASETRWVVRREDNDEPTYRGAHPYNVAFALADGSDDVYLAPVDEYCAAHEDEPADGCLDCADAEVARGDQTDRDIDQYQLAQLDRTT